MSAARRGSNIELTESNQDEVRFVDDFSDHPSDDNISMVVDDDEEEIEDDLLLDDDDAELSDSAIHNPHDFDDSFLDAEGEDDHPISDDLDDEAEADSSLGDDSGSDDGAPGVRHRGGLGESPSRTLRSFLPSIGGRREFSQAGGDITNLGALLGEALNGSFRDSGFGRVLRALRSQEDSTIIQGLHELSEMLLMPHHSFGFPMLPLDAISKALVSVLKQTSSIEIQVMTARAISQLLDNGMGSGTVKSLVNAGLVPVMTRLFENVFYIDLIEQLIHVVKPVAFVEPKLVLVSGCLNHCVGTLDFFNEHIQRQIMGAVESCTKAVDQESFESARELLAIFPEHPSPLVLGTWSLLLSAVARYGDVKELVNQNMWEVLVSSIQAGTPHVSRVMRATAHVAAKCPDYVVNAEALASTVVSTLVPSHDSASDIFNRLISVHKDNLFSGLKLLQVLLPLPSPIGPFSGPYRRQQTDKTPEISDIAGFSKTIAPLAISAYSATTSSQVRQLAILVVIQVIVALKKNAKEEVRELVNDMGILDFAVQIAAEDGENLSLTVGGLDIIWEMMSQPDLLQDLRNSGVSGDLEQNLPTGFSQNMPPEPVGHIGPTSDLSPLSGYMTAVILRQLNQERGHSVENAEKIVESLRQGDFNIEALKDVPVANLIRAGMLSVLSGKEVESYLSEDLVNILQSAVSRLEKFSLELTGSRATSLEDVVSRVVYVRIMERNSRSLNRAWSATVPILATLESIEEFVRSRIDVGRSLNDPFGASADSTRDWRIKFYSQNTRLPPDVSIMKAIAGQTGIPVIHFEVVGDEDDDEDSDVTRTNPEIITEPLSTALSLLRRLADTNERVGEPVSWDKFRSSKLTAKLSRQLADILAVSTSMLPQWTFDTVHKYPFLYPLEVRLHFVQLTSFGMGRNLRLLRRMQQENDDAEDDLLQELDESSRILGRHKRQKFRLARESLLEGALRLLEHSSKSPAIIEVMFNNEEGTGKGPTQEFFTLTSRALSDPALGMWDFTQSGLFFKPNMSPDNALLRYFRGMGVLVARALLDKRILDFQLNPAFFEAILSDTGPSVAKVRRVDPELANSLDRLLDAAPKDINAMGLDFTVPGSSEELLTGGGDIDVTAENVSDYVNLVCDRIVGSGIQQQVAAFVNGFSSTLPISALNSFMLTELAILCGADRQEDWSVLTLRDALRFQHGYHMGSTAVVYLLDTLSKFTSAERRKFLIFTTGSPHLPVGGFKALQPPLTVVVKPPDDEGLDSDRYLPSVMTCVNYFKLPDYSSQETLHRQLLLAMSEGSGSFPLS